MRPVMLSSGVLFSVAAALFPACGGSPSRPAPPSNTIPAIQGTYSGPTYDTTTSPPMQLPTWNLKFIRPGDGSARFKGCLGVLTIMQTGATFTGSFVQDAACAVGQPNGTAVTGDVVGGVVRTDGTITFALAGPAADPLAWTGFPQCAPMISGTLNFTGTVSGALLDASFAQDAFIRCPDQSITVNVHLRGTR